MAFRKSAVASQQRWFLTTRTAWQLVQLLRCREAIRFRLLVDDLRRRATARVLYRRLGRARLIVTGRAAVVAARVFATGLAVTRCAITRAAALGRRGTGGAAAAVARGVLATALWLAATWSACALGRSPGRRPRPGPVWLRARSRRGYRSYRYRRQGTRPGRGRPQRVVAGSAGAVRGPGYLHGASAHGPGVRHGCWSRIFLALVLAFVATTTATTAAVRAIAFGAAWVAWVTHVWAFARFWLLGLHGAGIEAHQVAVGDFLLGHAFDAFQQFSSSGATNEMASPERPARPVRPIRCT